MTSSCLRHVWRPGMFACLLAACVGQVSAPGRGDGPEPGDQPGGGTPPRNNPPGHQPPSMPPVSPPATGCAPPLARIWALTPEQYLRTVKVVLPEATLGADALTGSSGGPYGFSNEASRLNLTEPFLGELLELAHGLATAAAANPARLAPCLSQSPAPAACLRDFARDLTGRAFRRAATDAEVDALVMQHARTVASGDARAALRQLVMAVLTAPSMLFRTELGAEGGAPGAIVTLTPFEKASALSYLLTDGPPDAQLLTAARGGGLETRAQIETHTRRLLAGPETALGLQRLASELFGTRQVLQASKDAAVYPDFNETLATALADEADAFLRQVIWKEDGRLATVLSARFSVLGQGLAGFYGVTESLPAGGRKVMFPPGQRAGIFTLGALQATLAKDNDTDAVARGKFLREVLLCQTLPEPPANLNVVPPPPDGKNTMRQRLARHSADPTCAVCHDLMDPLGLAFEIYDGMGRHRTTDLGKPLEVKGTLVGAGPTDVAFGDGLELLGVLADSPAVAACFVRTAFRYGHGREPTAGDACAIDRLSRGFTTSGGRILDLAVAMTTDDSFVQRQNR
jgi:Protein of unknown function (DUF1588)/Protein of unknown function (DUF1592)/Protein of unknown function (DUF1595)/Protein of unknown function (DUF1585)